MPRHRKRRRRFARPWGSGFWLLLQKVFQQLEHFRILAAAETRDGPLAPLHRSLWIAGNLNQFVGYALVIRITERENDLVLQLLVLFRIVQLKQWLDGLDPVAAGDGTDVGPPQFPGVGATCHSPQFWSSSV